MSKQLTEKKQHYLTWSYLSRFAKDKNLDKNESEIYMAGRWSTDSSKVKTSSQCYREIDYIDVKLTKPQEIMRFTEIPLSEILNRYDTTKEISTEDSRILNRLLVFMHLRTISYENNIEVITNNTNTFFDHLVQKNYRILYAQRLLTYPRLSEDQIINLDISKFSKRFKINDAIDPKWKMHVIEHKKDVFLTSDNPVLFFTYHANSSPVAPLMILAINPSKLIFAYHSDYYELRPNPNLDSNTIDFINNQLFNRCNYVIYSNINLKSKKIDELRKNKDQTSNYDRLVEKKYGINLQVDHYPKKGFSFLQTTRKID